MKKIIIIAVVIIVVLAIMGACFGGTESSNAEDQGVGNASVSEQKSNLGNYNVVIDSCRLAEDYEGNPIVIVKYVFTNNYEEATPFYLTLDHAVYQDGIGLTECYLAADSANYSSDNQIKSIKTGATLNVEIAYTLNDTETDIEVEVKEMFSFNNKKIVKSFSIK